MPFRWLDLPNRNTGIPVKFEIGKTMKTFPFLIEVHSGNSVRLYFGGLQNTADGDCSHEIKRRSLLGRKVMTNLNSVFKSRDITLPTKDRLVKAMVFPVVIYGCELNCEESGVLKN